eukprot:GHVS01089791.1.p1 GENE.GHVS01089791.1~~GHVS01089791.1.p1  ORF type:complete len:970 (+),score=130.31 GHVS01089791.1:181-3090(+)
MECDSSQIMGGKKEQADLPSKQQDDMTIQQQQDDATTQQQEAQTVVGSGIPSGGGEAPTENHPERKHCVQEHVPLTDSVMWKMLTNYYKKMAVQAWSHNYVPSFVTSNSRLARRYARVMLSFFQDWFSRKDVDRCSPVYLVELGAGHGRFTFLVLRALLKFKDMFEALGLPARPFVYVFTDVAEANIDFCSKHSKLKPFAEDGWLDFAFLDGNAPSVHVDLINAGYAIPQGSPLVVVANYVLDSLLTDAFRIEGGILYRGAVAVYSPQHESDPTEAGIMTRMSVSWKWTIMPSSGSSPSYPGYMRDDPSIGQVLEEYLAMKQDMSFMLPVGSLRFLNGLYALTGGTALLVMVGDKGYTTSDEFVGIKPPHIAIHGSVSFMVNLHSLGIYVKNTLKGEYQATPWRDTFQLVTLWVANNLNGHSDMAEEESNHSKVTRLCSLSMLSFLDGVDNLPPDGLISWQRDVTDRLDSATMQPSAANLKTLLGLLRYSGHDADVFWNLRAQFSKWCLPPFTSSRTEADIGIDVQRVYSNWYKLRAGEDVADLCGHICMKIGKCDEAVHYFEESIKHCPEAVHAATYVNMASCYKVMSKLEKAMTCCEKALELSPAYQPCVEMQENLRMCMAPVRVAIIGCGHWIRNECLLLLLRDKRCVVVAAVAASEEEREWLTKATHFDGNLTPIKLFSSLDELLQQPDLKLQACAVESCDAMTSRLPLLWSHELHVLTRAPLASSTAAIVELINSYVKVSDEVAWHVVENHRAEDAFVQVQQQLCAMGPLWSVTIQHTSDTLLRQPDYQTAPYTPQQLLCVDALRCISSVNAMTGLSVSSLSFQLSPNAQTLTGWVKFAYRVVANLVVSRHAADNRVCYSFTTENGAVEVARLGSAWHITTKANAGRSSGTETSVHSIGHQNCHDAWFKQIRHKQKDGTKHGYLLDVSVSESVKDGALMQAITTSVHSQGVVIAIKDGQKKTQQ